MAEWAQNRHEDQDGWLDAIDLLNVDSYSFLFLFLHPIHDMIRFPIPIPILVGFVDWSNAAAFAMMTWQMARWIDRLLVVSTGSAIDQSIDWSTD